MTRSLLLLALLSLSSQQLQAQNPDDVFVARSDAELKDVLTEYNVADSKCGDKKGSTGSHARMVVTKSLSNPANSFLVVLTRNNKGTGMAKIDGLYCISGDNLNQFFRATRGWEVGVLTVPFKLRYDPVKVMAGNTLGGFFGRGMGKTATFGGFAGLTNVPLSDTNSDVPQTKWGVGGGLGLIWSPVGSFQIGMIGGVDLFEGVEDWHYGYKPWFSFSIGYAFLSSKRDKEAAKAVTPP